VTFNPQTPDIQIDLESEPLPNFCEVFRQYHPASVRIWAYNSKPGGQAVFCTYKIAKFDCITGEIRTSRDKMAISPEGEGVVSTQISRAGAELIIWNHFQTRIGLRFFIWAFKDKQYVEN
jgi:hypothetical protein